MQALGSGTVAVNGGTLNANVVQALGSGAVAINGGVLSVNAGAIARLGDSDEAACLASALPRRPSAAAC